jgi:glycosyltransferase involved in cell wall biosynthesis/LmbE family N-acetylglucosaminyl deacetylase
MRIIFSTYDDIKNPHYGGGGAIAVHEIAKRLSKNHTVKVISWNHSGVKYENIDNVIYSRFGSEKLPPKIGMILFFLLLPFFALREKYDVWFESFSPPFTATFLPLFSSKKIVGITHMLTSKDMVRKYKIPIFYILERLFIRNYKHIIATSPQTAKEIKHISPRAKITIIANGTDVPVNKKLTSKNKKSRKKQILYLGRIEINQKGLDLLIKVFEKVHKKTPTAQLVIVGGGTKSEVNKLQRIISKSPAKKNILVKGRVPRNEVAKIISESSCMLVTSRFETFCMSALEALAYSCPLFCFDIDGLRWIPKNSAFKIKPFDVEEMANKVALSFERPSMLDSKKGNGIKVASKFTWDSISKKYELVLNAKAKQTDVTRTLERISNKKIYFTSPHFDDAVFSAAGIISKLLQQKNKISLVNVFTRAESPSTISAKKFLSSCGFSSPEELYLSRSKEDLKIARQLKIKSINLGETDGLWRKSQKKIEKFGLFGKIIPELIHIYPIFRIHIKRGIVSQDDTHTIKSVCLKLKKIIDDSNESVVFCPLGIGRHIDHIITRNAVTKSFKKAKIIYWADYPYILDGNDQLSFIKNHRLKEMVFPDFDQKYKQKLIKGYKTQFKAIFPNQKIPPAPEIYYFR